MRTTTINKRSKLPYYQQLYDILYARIRASEWEPGDRIPSETELIDQYQVSRITVRDVLDMMVNKGLIYRERGRGTFVSQPTLEHNLVRIVNFTQDMSQRGLQPSSIVISSELVPAVPGIASKLDVRNGDELALLKRLRLGDDEPMALEESYLVHNLCPGILDKHDYSQYSLRRTIADDYGIQWMRASQVIRAVNASNELSELLEIKNRAALLAIERVAYSTQNLPVEFLRIYFRGDRYSLFNELEE